MGHWQGFTAVYADGGIYGISPTTRSDVSDQQLYFTCCWLPRQWRPLMWGSAPYLYEEVGNRDLYGAPRHISKVVLEVVVSATARRTRSRWRLSTIVQ
eukprot:5005234-Pleurochrysis_carterae.AAC.1